MRDLRIGVVGLGRSGQFHLSAWRKTAGVRVAAICDVKQAAIQDSAEPGLPVFRDAEEMLAAGGLDAISLCTPCSMRLSISEMALAAGINVLSEAPGAMNLRMAEQLIRAGQPSGTRLQLAMQYRHLAEVRLAKDLIQDGDIGEPMHFQVELSHPRDMSQHWKAQPSLSGGGVIMDQGALAFDLVRYLFGPISQVEAHRLKACQKLRVEDQVIAFVSVGVALRGQVVLSWSMRSATDFFLTVHGTRGSLALGWKASFIQQHGQDPVHVFNACSVESSYRKMMEDFRDIVNQRAPLWMTDEDTLGTQAAIDAAYRSLSSGRPAPVETFAQHSLSL